LLADGSLLAALEAGLPDCAGVSVGIERLHMVLDQAEDIRDVITFATETV
jgi:lysyl-tRNA synthetase class 2